MPTTLPTTLRTAWIALLLLSTLTTLRAQPTFWTLAIDDSPPLDLTPLPANIAPSDSVFLTRGTLSPAARARLAAGLGFEEVASIDPRGPGPAILLRSRPGRIPGDPRLRVERDGVAITALGHGATVAESLAAANDEPLPAAVLVGVHPDADPPAGWSRCGAADARPVVWNRLMHVQHQRTDGNCRRITFMDGPLHDRQAAELLRRYYAQAGRAQGPFPRHLQGIATDEKGDVYWSWTDRIVKTNPEGEGLAAATAEGDQGDLTWHDGKIVVAVNHGKFNDADGDHDSWAWVYDDDTLEVVGRHRLPEVRYGAGGICWAGDRYVVVGGLPVEHESAARGGNEVHEYDAGFRWLSTTCIGSGWTRLGIQTAEFACGRFFFGCYGEPGCVLVASPDLRHVERLDGAAAAYGVARGPSGMLLVGWDSAQEGAHRGGLHPVPPSSLWRRQ